MDSTSTTISSNSIARRFEELGARKRRALVGYLTAGFPDVDRSVECLRALDEGGADIIEIGVPFSDPIADGPVIQESSQRALTRMTFDRTLEIAARAKTRAPLVLFSYLNPILAAGEDALTRAADAGVSGILITDLPVGSDPALEERISAGPLAFIRLVAPDHSARTNGGDRPKHGSGFVHLISRLGVTGASASVSHGLRETVALLRSTTKLPICAGFGISTPEQAREVGGIADGLSLAVHSSLRQPSHREKYRVSRAS